MIESATVETVPVPPEQVFDFVADPANQEKWNSELSNPVLLTEGPPRVGSRMSGDYSRIGRIETEITVYERPSRLVLSSSGAQADMTLDFRFTPEGTGTRMTVTGAVSLKGALRFMEGVLRGPVAQQFQARGQSIRAALS